MGITPSIRQELELSSSANTMAVVLSITEGRNDRGRGTGILVLSLVLSDQGRAVGRVAPLLGALGGIAFSEYPVSDYYVNLE